MPKTEIRGASDLAAFISRSYQGKVVEVGIGHRGDVAALLEGLEVLATDRVGRSLGSLAVREDDVFSPKKEIYRGASLLYSVRPPLEIQLAMGRLALEIGADVLVRPLGDEVAELKGFKRRLVNSGQARFYLFEML